MHLVVWLVADLLRHALPLVPLYWFHGSIASYTLLTAFDLSLGLWLIIVTTRDAGDVNSVDPRSRWMVFQILSVLLAATRFQTSFYQRTTAGGFGPATSKGPVLGNLDADRRESLAAQAAQVTLIATFAGLCYLLIMFGSRGLSVLPALYAAALMFYDIRPDIAQKIFPSLWQKAESATSQQKTPPARGRRPSR